MDPCKSRTTAAGATGRLSRISGCQSLDVFPRGSERPAAVRLAHRQALGIDELDIADAKEAEEIPEVIRLCIHPGALVSSAARGHHVGLLAGEQALRNDTPAA
jgi:hypothetical protein